MSESTFLTVSVPPRLFLYLPSVAVFLTTATYLYGNLVAGRAVVGARNEANAEDRKLIVVNRRSAVLTLQILVGSLVTFGGSAYVLFALNSLGTAFGTGHLLVGMSDLSVGIFAVSRKELPRSSLLGVNILTIAYSLISDSAAGFFTLLPSDAFHDSIIGTAAAVAMSCAVIYILRRQ